MKYNNASYYSNSLSKLTNERIKNQDFNYEMDVPNNSDMIREELYRATMHMGLTYKTLPQYIISENIWIF